MLFAGTGREPALPRGRQCPNRGLGRSGLALGSGGRRQQRPVRPRLCGISRKLARACGRSFGRRLRLQGRRQWSPAERTSWGAAVRNVRLRPGMTQAAGLLRSPRWAVQGARGLAAAECRTGGRCGADDMTSRLAVAVSRGVWRASVSRSPQAQVGQPCARDEGGFCCGGPGHDSSGRSRWITYRQEGPPTLGGRPNYREQDQRSVRSLLLTCGAATAPGRLCRHTPTSDSRATYQPDVGRESRRAPRSVMGLSIATSVPPAAKPASPASRTRLASD